jgi:hypothetical protein
MAVHRDGSEHHLEPTFARHRAYHPRNASANETLLDLALAAAVLNQVLVETLAQTAVASHRNVMGIVRRNLGGLRHQAHHQVIVRVSQHDHLLPVVIRPAVMLHLMEMHPVPLELLQSGDQPRPASHHRNVVRSLDEHLHRDVILVRRFQSSRHPNLQMVGVT